MRIFDAIRIAAIGAVVLAAAPAHAFDVKQEARPAASPLVPIPPADIPNVKPSGKVANGIAPASLAPSANSLAPDTDLPSSVTAYQAFRTGTQAYLAGEKQKALKDLGYAAEQGHALATWKLGRMYAEGDGVKQNHLKAFHYFSKLASDNADVSPYSQQARFVSNAFVAVGSYYLSGIPNSQIKPDHERAREMYSYAASYFGDPDAQYRLARIYLEDKHGLKDTRQGARWLSLAANKGQHQAQALLGHLLFNGEQGLPKMPARGLMWLSLARDGASAPGDGWIADYYADAYAHSSDEERGLAQTYAQEWASNQH